jgi:hypothetical protein
MLRKSKYARRERDRAYLSWIGNLPCLLCGGGPAEAAHVGARGLGQKCSDQETAPLCAWDHRMGPHSHHSLGKRFWQHHGLDRVKLIRELNETYARGAVMAQARGRPFEPGNTFGAGRPAGSRNKRTIALQDILDRNAESILATLVELAIAGEPWALRFSIDRLLPPLKEMPLDLDIEPISSVEDAVRALDQIWAKVIRGQLSANQAKTLYELLKHRITLLCDEQFQKPKSTFDAEQRALVRAQPTDFTMNESDILRTEPSSNQERQSDNKDLEEQ